MSDEFNIYRDDKAQTSIEIFEYETMPYRPIGIIVEAYGNRAGIVLQEEEIKQLATFLNAYLIKRSLKRE